jgi:hypothetical protein
MLKRFTNDRGRVRAPLHPREVKAEAYEHLMNGGTRHELQAQPGVRGAGCQQRDGVLLSDRHRRAPEADVTIEGTTTLSNAGGNALIGKVADAFGISQEQAQSAVNALVPELKARIQRSMLSRGGVADVVSLVTSPAAGRTLSGTADLASPQVAAAGNRILDVLIGSKHVSRGIAARAASQADLDAGTVEKILPVAASLLIGELQRQSGPAIAKLVSGVPGLVSAGGSPLPLPGDTIPPATDGSADDGVPPGPGATPPRTQSVPRGPIDAGRPLPIPGDNIPGVGRRQRSPDPEPEPAPEEENPYDRLPDIVRCGGQQVPGGGTLENVIRSIIGSLLGSNRGVIGTMIQLFLIRWLTSLVRSILSRVFAGR